MLAPKADSNIRGRGEKGEEGKKEGRRRGGRRKGEEDGRGGGGRRRKRKKEHPRSKQNWKITQTCQSAGSSQLCLPPAMRMFLLKGANTCLCIPEFNFNFRLLFFKQALM